MAADTINTIFRDVSGYDTSSIGISDIKLQDTLIPSAEKILENMGEVTITISNYVSASTGDLLDDMIMGHLSAFLADNIMDKVHIDPETGLMENRHWEVAERLALQKYGRYNDEGELKLPYKAYTASYYVARTFAGEADYSTYSYT